MAEIEIALSVRQPWAWMILHAGKDVENRVWRTAKHGRILLHASKGMTGTEYLDARDLLRSIDRNIQLPEAHALDRGGIVGSVDLVDCVTWSRSPWFFGPYGFTLRDPKPLPFKPCAGKLQFFKVVM